MTFGGLRLLAVLNLTVYAAFAVLPLRRETPMVANLLVVTRAVPLGSGPLLTACGLADPLPIIYLQILFFAQKAFSLVNYCTQ